MEITLLISILLRITIPSCKLKVVTSLQDATSTQVLTRYIAHFWNQRTAKGHLMDTAIFEGVWRFKIGSIFTVGTAPLDVELNHHGRRLFNQSLVPILGQGLPMATVQQLLPRSAPWWEYRLGMLQLHPYFTQCTTLCLIVNNNLELVTKALFVDVNSNRLLPALQTLILFKMDTSSLGESSFDQG